jgi:hypothetical protein
MATAKKNLYLTSEVDIPTGEKQEKGEMKPLKRVGPGILSELDITDAEIKTLPRGVVRAATADEIEAAEQRADTEERRALLAEQSGEVAALRAKQADELAATAPDKQPALQERHAKAMTALQEKHAKALNA